MPKVSIIVPVYNGEQFLKRCINSILNQTEQDTQLILVNDGSTDGSGALCDAFAKRDNRIVVIHQKNAGVSAARNAGVEAAIGDYIGFVDADDYIAEHTYEMALTAMDTCDIVMWDTVSIWDNGRTEADTIPLLDQDCVLCKADLKPELLRFMAGSAYRCLYKRETIDGIRFPVGVKFSEDRVFNLYAMGKAKGLCYLKQGLYYRVMQPESAVHRYHEDHFEACKRSHFAIQKALADLWPQEEYRVAYQSQLVAGALGSMNNYCYQTSPLTWPQRICKIKELCQDADLQQALSQSDFGGLRAKLMKKKCAVLLCCLAWLTNKKHGR